MGSSCYDGSAFSEAIASAYLVFQVAEEFGFNFDLLDIGGGFPGQPCNNITFKEVGWCQTIGALFHSTNTNPSYFIYLRPFYRYFAWMTVCSEYKMRLLIGLFSILLLWCIDLRQRDASVGPVLPRGLRRTCDCRARPLLCYNCFHPGSEHHREESYTS